MAETSLNISADIMYNVCALTTNETLQPLRHSEVGSHGIPEGVYIIFCALVMVIFMAGLVQNTLTIYVFIKDRFLRKVHNVFIVSLAIGDVAMCVFGVWMVVVAAIYRKWIFGAPGCVYYGFTTTLLGITQISLLATIAMDRYLVIARPKCLKPISMRTSIIVVFCCYGYGLFWAIFPAIGWSSYELEGIRLRCAINWRSRQSSDVSFTMTLLVLGWLVPLAAIAYCCIRIGILIRREAAKPVRLNMRNRQKSTHGKFRKSTSREKRVAVTVFLMIGAFFLSWTPYSIVTLIVMFGDPDDIPASLLMVPALCAKSSIVWNPIIYVARHREYRNACFKHLPFIAILRKKTGTISENSVSKINESSTINQNESINMVPFR